MILARYEALQAVAGPYDQKPVIIMPTNAAMHRFLLANEMSGNPQNWSRSDVAQFRNASGPLVISWRTAKNRWPKYFVNCTLLGVTHDMTNPLNSMGLQLWNGKGPGLQGSLLSKQAAVGRRLQQQPVDSASTAPSYGVLGQGYNTAVGNPDIMSGGGESDGLYFRFNNWKSHPS